MSLKAQAVRGLKWQAIEIAGRQVLSLVVFATLARLLTPADFGLVGLVAVYLAFVGMFAEQGMGTALIQRKDLEPQHVNAAFWFNLACSLLLCAGTIAAAPLVARLFTAPALEPLLRWASLGLVINASAAVHGVLFIREMDFRRPMMRTLVANIAGGAVGIGMAVGGFGVWALIGQQLTSAAAGAAFLWIASPWRPSLGFSVLHLRQLMAVSGSVFATGLLWFFSSRLDQVVIGRAFGTAALGQYTVGAKFPELARSLVQQPLAAVSMPAFATLQNDHPRMCRTIYKGMELNALVSVPAFVGLAAIAPTLIPTVLGTQWANAIVYTQLWALYSLVIGLFVYCTPALLASGGPGKYVAYSALAVAGTVTACAIGMRYGPVILLSALIVNIAVTGVLSLFFLRGRMGLSPRLYLQPAVIPFIAAATMFACIDYSRKPLETTVGPWTLVGLEICVGAVVYVALLAVLRGQRLLQLFDLGWSIFRPRST